MEMDYKERLRQLCPPGTRVYTIVRHVTSSGMGRWITPFVIDDDGEPYDLTWLIKRAGIRSGRGNKHEGIYMGGCGMDMGFALVYHLGSDLWRDTPEHEEWAASLPPHQNPDAGYALKHSWF